MIIASAVLAGCCKKGGAPSPSAKGGPGAKSRVMFPVEVAPVELRTMVYSVSAVGSVDAFEKVQVTSRVPGVVDRVLFAEGSAAAVDQVLVEVSPERYRLAVEAAQATYEKALAAKADAEAGLKRREQVITKTPGLIPGEEVETWRTKVLLAAADVAQAKAALDQAKLNLHDAYVRAPFSGILQTRTVQTGQYVDVGIILATLVRRDPLLLRFQVPERDAAQMHPGIKAAFRMRDDTREYGAQIVHVGAAADETTRMVSVTAEVRDSNASALRPGAFAEITVPVSNPHDNPVIPQTAIRPSDRGFIAYVVENDIAVERVVTVGMRTADGQAEVLAGLKAGEILVVRGSEALRDGAPVRIGKAPEKAPEKAPANR
ncbi:MAG: efflux RND transporter periplasmic adaptor subunit [Candidatus Aminicenantales bacterium]